MGFVQSSSMRRWGNSSLVQSGKYGMTKMMFMGRVNLCEREMSKRMENKEKSEKIIRKTGKERNLDLVVPFLQKSSRRYSELWKLCSQYSELRKLRSRYLELQKSCSWYLVYDGNMVIGTRSTTIYYGWYSGYDGWLLVVLYARLDDVAGTRGHEGLRGWYLFYGSIYLNEGLQLVT